MHRLALALLLACHIPGAQAGPDDGEPAAGKRPHKVSLASDACGLSTPFNVLVDGGGVWLSRDSGSPREIFFHAGELSVDRQVRRVSPADAARLWQMEAQSRQLMTQVTGLAHQVSDVSFTALALAVEGVSGSARKARSIGRYQRQASAYIDRTLGIGRWDQEVFDEGFEEHVQTAARQISGTLVRSALWQAMTGRGERMEARMDEMDARIEDEVDARAGALQASAQALCPQVRQLYALQQSLEYRYQGHPLTMLEDPGQPALPDQDEQDDRDHAEVPVQLVAAPPADGLRTD